MEWSQKTLIGDWNIWKSEDESEPGCTTGLLRSAWIMKKIPEDWKRPK